MTEHDPKSLAEIYFDAWPAGDYDRLRTVLSDDVTFRGPLGTATGVEECLQGLQGIGSMMTGLEVVTMVADESDVITWYELQTAAATLVTANWSHVENGRIVAIQATFDPRPVLPPESS